MRRNWTNLIIDMAIAATMLGVAVTGIVLRYALPSGAGRRRGRGGLALWGWSRHEWRDIHFWFAVIAIVLLLLHVVLHWRWLRGMFRRLRPSKRAEVGARPVVADT